MTKKTPTAYTYAFGRRKSSIATVKLFLGKQESQINNQSSVKYFPDLLSQNDLNEPFILTSNPEKYYFLAKIVGGGKKGQKDALVLAISRALRKIDQQYTPLLRSKGLLTVDSRVRQRRQVGTGGKARRQKQSPKR
ncbi:MAG: 30S ribosomal protein S9 [Candidatus Shapirobacteria bacterium]|jgi:small subunit ribosomal protein S9